MIAKVIDDVTHVVHHDSVVQQLDCAPVACQGLQCARSARQRQTQFMPCEFALIVLLHCSASGCDTVVFERCPLEISRSLQHAPVVSNVNACQLLDLVHEFAWEHSAHASFV